MRQRKNSHDPLGGNYSPPTCCYNEPHLDESNLYNIIIFMSQSKGVGGLPPLFVEPTAANDPFEAARVDDITALRKHMESGSHSVDSVDGDGRNSLHWAATKGNLSIVRFLLSENADPNKCDEDSTYQCIRLVLPF
mmetsp:Transcript_5260/g.6396  ORF Transcript_5260/g.6396 Transcript_5260/m.6396 type:complete len:136 (-) Transcript_5260:548-955(-)